MDGFELVEGNSNEVSTYPLPSDVVLERDVMVTMTDGVRLALNVYRPTGDGRFPVLMAISPYGKDDFDGYRIFATNEGAVTGRIRISDHVAFEAPDPGYWVPRGYVVIQADVRGQGRSEGDTNTLSVQEQDDYQTLIGWAAAQEWSNGAVALHGVSYLAITQWFVAQHRPPALKAIVPWEGWTEPYGRAYFGGIPEVGFLRFVVMSSVLPAHNPKAGFVPVGDPAEHPLYDDFWKARAPRLENIVAPALICASFSDQELHSRDSFDAFARIGSEERWLYNHRAPKWSAYYSEEALKLQERFLAHFLKGEETGIESTPRVRFQINESRDVFEVRHADAWPPTPTTRRRLYLDARAVSLSNSPVERKSSLDYDAQTGGASFALTFDRDVVLVGNMKARLWVEAIDSDDMDLFVGIRKVDAEGRQVYFYGFSGQNANDCVARGWLRVSHRASDPSRSTEMRPYLLHDREELLSAAQVVPVEIEILPSATRFRAGETLSLVVQGLAIQPDSSMLEFDRLRNRGTHRIHTGGPHDSYLLVDELVS